MNTYPGMTNEFNDVATHRDLCGYGVTGPLPDVIDQLDVTYPDVAAAVIDLMCDQPSHVSYVARCLLALYANDDTYPKPDMYLKALAEGSSIKDARTARLMTITPKDTHAWEVATRLWYNRTDDNEFLFTVIDNIAHGAGCNGDPTRPMALVMTETKNMLEELRNEPAYDAGIRAMSYDELVIIAVEHSGVVTTIPRNSTQRVDELSDWTYGNWSAKWVYRGDRRALVLTAKVNTAEYEFIFIGRCKHIQRLGFTSEASIAIERAMREVRESRHPAVVDLLLKYGDELLQLRARDVLGMSPSELVTVLWADKKGTPPRQMITAATVINLITASEVSTIAQK